MVQYNNDLGWFGAVVLLFNSTVGAGLLSFPFSVIAAGGFFYGFGTVTIIVAISLLSLAVISWLAYLHNAVTFQEMVGASLGDRAYAIFEILFLLLMLGGTMHVQTGLSDQLQRISMDAVGDRFYCTNWIVRRTFLSFLITLLILLPQCLSQDLKDLKYVSFFAVMGVCYIVFSVIYSYLRKDFEDPTIPSRPKSVNNFILAIPGFILGYTLQNAVVSVYAEAKERNLWFFGSTYTAAVILATIAYMLTSYFAGMTYGTNISENFIVSFDSSDWLIRTAIICYAFKLCFAYPVLQYIGWRCLRTILGKTSVPIENKIRFFRIISSILWCTVTFLVTSTFPNLEYIMPPISVVAMLTLYMIPGVCLAQVAMLLFKSATDRPIICIGLMAAGIFLVLVGAFISAVVIYNFPTAFSVAAEQSTKRDICIKT